MSVNSLGVKVFTGEKVSLVVAATDRCGNVASASFNPAEAPSPLCDDVIDNLACCPLGPPPARKCKEALCGR